ncbi:MAG: fibrobacter succinogenes major paralogous domain-containing protein, partial [Candidatus Marinimicrobia bacterium]|nr:fibrobacter succinogenes major paralogous domain-containing protein [Candidatus Neomarinimicrobiota bacterium]
MKKILTSIVLTISPILAQCDWNRDMSIDVLDIVPMVDCILYDCWNGTQCDWNGDGIINILDIIATVGCIINECAVFGCSDPIANSYNGNIDDGSCEYTDIDGNAFTSIVIGNQRWMVENIRVTHYRNGDPLPNVILDDEWMGLYVGAYSENPYFSDFVDTYGRIYNWYAVDDERGVCPEGWYVPSDEEWMELEVSQGMSLEVAQLEGYYRGTDEGGKLKEVGTTHWDEPNEGATNESGFTALPGGYRQGFNGWFMGVGSIGAFWSSTEGEVFIDWAMMRRLYYNYSQISRFDITKQNGMSVRCVRGAEDAIYGCTDPGACNYIPEA